MNQEEIPNWGGLENGIMKGYIKYAISQWNLEHPEELINSETEKNLNTALNWATSDKTAIEAYSIWLGH